MRNAVGVALTLVVLTTVSACGSGSSGDASGRPASTWTATDPTADVVVMSTGPTCASPVPRPPDLEPADTDLTGVSVTYTDAGLTVRTSFAALTSDAAVDAQLDLRLSIPGRVEDVAVSLSGTTDRPARPGEEPVVDVEWSTEPPATPSTTDTGGCLGIEQSIGGGRSPCAGRRSSAVLDQGADQVVLRAPTSCLGDAPGVRVGVATSTLAGSSGKPLLYQDVIGADAASLPLGPEVDR